MRKVFLENLPKRGSLINWKKSVGLKVHFIYDDIEDDIEIIGHNPPEETLTTNYKGLIHKVNIGNFKKGGLGGCIGKDIKNKNFIYKVGDIINTNTGGMEVLEQRQRKGFRAYYCKCVNCNYKRELSESKLNSKRGCTACGGYEVVKGINDIATTHPHLVKYFKDKEDAYKYSKGSHDYVSVICPDCGAEKRMTILHLTRYGFVCKKCSDSISFPEKFMMGVLNQLNINYQPQKMFEWSNNNSERGKRIYDFYFEYNNESYIIETHGNNHYEKSFDTCGGKTIKEIQENDLFKKKLALNNGIKEENYIVVNCKYSTLEWCKEHILNNRLNEIFDLTTIDWLKCLENTATSNIKKVSKLWSEYKSVKKIAEITGFSSSAIRSWLKKGAKLGWCNYDPKEASKHKIRTIKTEGTHVICNETKEWFLSARKAGGYYNIDKSGILRQIRGERKRTRRKNPDGTITYFTWSYYNEDYIKEHGEGTFIDN